MDGLIMEPLEFYRSSAKDKHNEAVNAYFDELVKRSGVDAAANRSTAKKYRAQQKKAESITKAWKKKKALRVFLVILSILLPIVGIGVALMETLPLPVRIAVPAVCLVGAVVILVIIFRKLNKTIKALDLADDKEYALARKILAEAEAQMAPLNALFDDDATKKLVEGTIPALRFEDHYSVKSADLFKRLYDFVDSVNGESSMTELVSGTLFGNPFLFQRYLSHTMGTHTYYGSIVIRWTETYRDSEGRLRTRTRTQTLTASVVKPKPYYTYHTVLGYGNQGAPNLHFSREAQHHEQKNEKEREKHIKKGEKKLRQKAEDALEEGRSFTEMANSEFDVLFGATNRDNEVEFRLMFTPLAQNNMVDLMTQKDGYGDDFAFIKNGRYSLIRSEHAQRWDMNTSGARYRSYDVDDARKRFVDYNNEYFKSVFFDLAPLLAVPVYHEEPVASMEEMEDYGQYYTNYEYEVLANAMDQKVFAHPASATDAILKTTFSHKNGTGDSVEVTAFSYAAENRVDIVPMLGGDGRWHNVPVPWIEYIPLARTRTMGVKELGLSEKGFRDGLSGELGNTLGRYEGRSAYRHGLFGFALFDDERWS